MGDTYEGLPVSIRQTPDGRFYSVGVEIHGAFFPFTFAQFTKESFEDSVATAKENEQAATETTPPTHDGGY